jgi:uncharacterized protein
MLAPEQATPLNLVVLQATPFCNIDCRYCYLPDRTDTSRMSFETLRKAARFVRDLRTASGTYKIVWHAGEPCVLPASWYARAHEILSSELGEDRVTFHVQTNATLLSPEWIRLLRDDPRCEIGVSIDGPAEIHDAHRRTRSGKGTHARVMAGVGALRDAGIPFGCIAVITGATLDHPDAFYDFFVELGGSFLGLNLEELEGAHRSSSLLGKTTEVRFRRFIRRLAELWMRDDGKLKIRELVRFRAALAALPPDEPRAMAPQSDAKPWGVVSIDVRGNVHTFSPELLGIDVPGIGRSLGHVDADTWRTIQGRGELVVLADDIASGINECQNTCDYYRYCGGGSPSNKWFEHGTFAATETMYCRFAIKAILDEYLVAARNVESRASAE